ncbi:MAG: hypothetical protein ACJ8EH_00040 [Sphingomicrobium sp.]
MTLYVILGAVALVAGIAMLVTGIRGGIADSPRNAVLLIAGMMAAAFGVVLGGFAIAYQSAGQLDLNTQTNS